MSANTHASVFANYTKKAMFISLSMDSPFEKNGVSQQRKLAYRLHPPFFPKRCRTDEIHSRLHCSLPHHFLGLFSLSVVQFW